MVKYLHRLLLFILFLLLVSCEIINKEEAAPSYINIENINLTSKNNQGSASAKITDAWVFVDNEFIGAFELPAKFPVLVAGSHKVRINAGIKKNGITSTRAIYPFFETDTSFIELTPGRVTNINPTVTYTSYTTFKWIEDFESAGISLEKSANSDTSLVVQKDESAIEGNYGAVFLDQSHPFFEYTSSQMFNLPIGSNVYLELNYKIDYTMVVGVYATLSSGSEAQYPVIYLNPTINSAGNLYWNKIYIDLSSAISTLNATNYKIFFGSKLTSDIYKANYYLDNIKLLH